MGKKMIILVTVMLAFIAFISLQGKAGELSGAITIAGSTSVQPLAEELAEVFMKKHPRVQIFVQGGGSSAGIQAVLSCTAGVGSSSRNLKPSEELYATTIALDGIAIVINPKNPLAGITLQEVQQIFAGEITSWGKLGVTNRNLRNKDIVVVNREAGSGTRGAFEELVMDPVKKSLTVNSLVQAQTGAVQQVIRTTETAIG
ncbi:MAG TPA: phosphate-binding protein, partial [Firmicutes bacterium]|nr:phosphate-binding protein [Bacillota bacterium]